MSFIQIPDEIILHIIEYCGISTHKLAKISKNIRHILLGVLNLMQSSMLPETDSDFTKLVVGTDPMRLLSIWGSRTSHINKELLLMDAIRVGDIRAIDRIIRRGVDLNHKNMGTQPCRCAVSFNRPECLRTILSYNPSSPFPPTEGDTFVEDMFTHTSDVVFQIPVNQSIPPIILDTYISRGDLSIFTRRRWMSDHRVFKWFKEAAEKVPFGTAFKVYSPVILCDCCLDCITTPYFCHGWVRCKECTSLPMETIKLRPRVAIYDDSSDYDSD